MKKSLSLVSALVLLAGYGPAPPIQDVQRQDALDVLLHEFCSTHDKDTMALENVDLFQQLLPGFRSADFNAAVVPDMAEAHDCQAFIRFDEDGVPREYGDVFLIFSTLRLSTLERDLRPIRVQQACPAAVRDCPDAGVTTSAIPAAYIMAGGPYLDLGIHAPGAHCLVLYKDNGAWQAKMVPLERYPDLNCLGEIDPWEVGGDSLLVQWSPSIGAKYYPTSARWSVDRFNSIYLAVLKCAPAMECEVGRREGFVMSRRPAPDYGGGSTNDDLGTWRVRIRYDEQYLAVVDRDGVLKPTRILGRIIPDRRLLDHTDDASAFDGTWVDVARVHLMVPGRLGPLEEKALEGYQARFNFKPPVRGRRFNEISLCDNESGRCGGALPVCTNGETWFSKIVATDGSERYLCVVRHELYEIGEDGQPRPAPTPHNARFRFLTGVDEGVWVWCPLGCCQP